MRGKILCVTGLAARTEKRYYNDTTIITARIETDPGNSDEGEEIVHIFVDNNVHEDSPHYTALQELKEEGAEQRLKP
ncbi:hypothetical protein [Alteribacillus sp. YIM 98480]|uniref:hypothetical protein n=1 Tax=Alteribacillus sp. YIM 98480 TaxID=2606599 RepID=UPI00131D1C45|nr:hypothetical protein [Alteribacillus sp. YIM 98480]